MADDLSAPLGVKQAKPARSRRARAIAGGFPLGRVALALAGLIVAVVGGRILLVHDPMGGRPSAEVSVNAARNSIADSVATASTPVTIDAGPEFAASGGPAVTVVGDDVPDSAIASAGDPAAPGRDGLYPDLLEPTEHGDIPRMSATGQTPFEAYAPTSLTPATAEGRKLIAVVVTGLGLNAAGTGSAIAALPGPVTLAFAPYGPNLASEAAEARDAGHEILLQVPLEPFDYPESDPGPDTLLTGQAPRDNLDRLFTVLASFGGYVGLINHMGARFTASTADFAPIMEELGARGLGYLDDGASNRSVAPQLAAAKSVEFGRADMVLDDKPERGRILERLQALETRATEQGSAIGIISALPVSVQTLAEWAATTADRGYTIVPVSALMQKPQ